MTSRTLLLAICVLGFVPSADAADAPAFAYRKPIVTGSLEREELLAVPLDSAVYAATRPEFQDLRVVNEAGEFVPFIVRRATETRAETTRSTWQAANASLQPLETGGLAITIEMGDKKPSADGLQIVTPLRDYEQRVRIEGSADGNDWLPMVEDSLIFDYSRYMDVSSNEIPLPANQFRKLRITIAEVTAEQRLQLVELTRRLQGDSEDITEEFVVDRRPFRIDRIDLWENVEQARATKSTTRQYPTKGFSSQEDAEKQQTVLTIETAREPLTSLTLTTESRNFSRTVHVAIEQNEKWRDIATETLSRLEFRDTRREDVTIDFPETRSAKYRISIDNRESVPLKVSGVKAQGTIVETILLASPAAKYELAYGSEKAQAAALDTAAVSTLLGQGTQPVAATLGEQQETATVEAPDVTEHFKNPVIIGTGLAVLVAILAVVLYQAARRVDRMPPE